MEERKLYICRQSLTEQTKETNYMVTAHGLKQLASMLYVELKGAIPIRESWDLCIVNYKAQTATLKEGACGLVSELPISRLEKKVEKVISRLEQERKRHPRTLKAIAKFFETIEEGDIDQIKDWGNTYEISIVTEEGKVDLKIDKKTKPGQIVGEDFFGERE